MKPGPPDREERAALIDAYQQRLTGSWMAQALCAAAELGLADRLAGGPRTAAALADETATDALSLQRLLRALASIDVCREREDGSFELAPLGALLSSDSDPSLHAWTIWWGRHLWPVWGNLLHSVRTGGSARTRLLGTEGFQHLERDPEAAAIFYRATVELTRIVAPGIVQAWDFSTCSQVADIGGGHGQLLASILRSHPRTRGILFDVPQAINGARGHLAREGVLDRCECVAGDFFRAVPAGADLYVLKSVIHDWDDERARRVLRSCRRAMSGTARLLLVEHVLPDPAEGAAPAPQLARHDLTMLVACGSRERTRADYETLLQSAEFAPVRVVPAGYGLSLIEAEPR